MPALFQHRVNTIDALTSLAPGLGLEFDVREGASGLVVTHDAFTAGPPLERFLEQAHGPPLIVNLKCAGIEGHVLRALERAGVGDFFLLDCALPTLVKLVAGGERRVAVRWSEWEPREAVERFRGRAAWIWADCFTRFPGDDDDWRALAADFRICVVSPELQGRPFEAIGDARRELANRPFHAVCTKRPLDWRRDPERGAP